MAELTGDNVPKDFSDDHSYPDPPNPCPLGKTGRNSSPVQSIFKKKHSFLQNQHRPFMGLMENVAINAVFKNMHSFSIFFLAFKEVMT